MRATSFTRGVFTLVSGTSLAQIIPILVTPVLTRVFSPSEFGVLALFAAFAAVLTTAANARYEMAIMLPDDDRDALTVAAVGMCIASMIAAIAALSVWVWGEAAAELLDAPALMPWLWLLPVVVWFGGLYNSLNLLSNRMSRYRAMAGATITRTGSTAAAQVGLGLGGVGGGSLIVGYALGYVAAVLPLLRVVRAGPLLSAIEWRPMLAAAYRYRKFPLLSLPASFSNVLSSNLPAMLIPVVFGAGTLGQYNLVQRLLGAPTSIVGQAVGQVFYREAAEQRRETGSAVKVYDRTTLRLSVVAFPSFAGIYFFAPQLFGVVFGAEWREAGEYAKLMVPFFAARFIVAAVSHTTTVFERQGVALAWQLIFLVGSAAVVLAAVVWSWTFEQYLTTFSWFGALHYCLLYAMLRRIARRGR